MTIDLKEEEKEKDEVPDLKGKGDEEEDRRLGRALDVFETSCLSRRNERFDTRSYSFEPFCCREVWCRERFGFGRRRRRRKSE